MPELYTSQLMAAVYGMQRIYERFANGRMTSFTGIMSIYHLVKSPVKGVKFAVDSFLCQILLLF